jgi:hypothetical protein
MSNTDWQQLGQILSSWVEGNRQLESDITVKDSYTSDSGNIVFNTGSSEMLRISEDGFWVRGVRVEQTAREAEIVYNNFRQWLTWAQLNRE